MFKIIRILVKLELFVRNSPIETITKTTTQANKQPRKKLPR